MSSPARVARSSRPLPPVVIVLVATPIVLSLATLVGETAIRAALVVPLALVVPGYGLLVASFGPWLRLDLVLAAALSVALSVSLYPLLALMLYAAGIDLSRSSVLAATDAVLVGLAIVTAIRARRVDVAQAVWVPARLPAESSRVVSSAWSGLRGWMLFVSAVAIVIAALAVLLPRLPSPVSEPYTQLALRGRWAAVNTVALARPGRALRVDLAVVNRTHERHRYRLVPRLPGGRGWAARTVTLRPGERWAGSVYGTVPRRGCLHRLAVGLHGAAGHRVAAEVLTLWVRSSEIPDARCGPL